MPGFENDLWTWIWIARQKKSKHHISHSKLSFLLVFGRRANNVQNLQNDLTVCVKKGAWNACVCV